MKGRKQVFISNDSHAWLVRRRRETRLPIEVIADQAVQEKKRRYERRAQQKEQK